MVPIDGSENAFRAASFAVDLARRYGAELVAIHALEVNQTLASLGIFGASNPQNIAKILDVAGKETAPWFDRVKEEADATGVSMKSEMVYAPLSLVGEIVNYAERVHAGLIVMGSRGRTGFTKLIMGSVAWSRHVCVLPRTRREINEKMRGI